MTFEGPIVTFGADGALMGAHVPPDRWNLDEDAKWHAVAGAGAVRWEEDDSRLRRLAPDGSVAQTIEHRPDGAWLVSISNASVAPDGSLAVLCSRGRGAGGWGLDRGPRWLCLYALDGRPREMLIVPQVSSFLSLRYDGSNVFFCDEKGVTVLKTPLAGAHATRFDLPGEKGSFWHTMLRPDGTLAAWEHGTRVVRTFSLAQDAQRP